MPDAYDPERLKKLRAAIRYSRRKLEVFRSNRVHAIKEFVGRHYSEDGANDRRPINLIQLAARIYSRFLSAKAPRALITTDRQELKAWARTFELDINHLIREIDLDSTLKRVTMDAILGVGIAKVGLSMGHTIEIDGFTHDIGQPYCDPVSLDEFCVDMTAGRWDQISYIGNRYRMPLEYAKDANLYDKKAREKLQAAGQHGEEDSGDRASEVTRDDQAPQEYGEFVNLWDVWLPIENMVVTFPDSQEDVGVLRADMWNGPEHGPFHILSFEEVPDSLIPLPPVADWRDQHDLANRLMRKLSRQAERQKTITVFRGNAEADGKRIVQASDGDAVHAEDPQGVREMVYGGIHQPNMAFTVWISQLFNKHAGNLDSLGGLGPQADTLGQEKLISSANSLIMNDMQERKTKFTQKLLQDLAWYEWSDPLLQREVYKQVPGTQFSVPVRFSQDSREGDFLDYNIQISPYSMTHETPGSELNKIMQLLQILAPFLPMLEQAGMQLNFEKLARLYARYTNMPDLEEIVVFGAVPQSPEQPIIGSPRAAGPAASQPGRPRVNLGRPGATQAGAEKVMMNALLGNSQLQGQ